MFLRLYSVLACLRCRIAALCWFLVAGRLAACRSTGWSAMAGLLAACCIPALVDLLRVHSPGPCSDPLKSQTVSSKGQNCTAYSAFDGQFTVF